MCSRALLINPDDLATLQTVRADGSSTSGCIAANITGSSGVIGGANRTIIMWGTMDAAGINWCIGR